MEIKKMFVCKGRLRTGWRILVFFIVTFFPLYYITQLLWDELLIRYFILFWILLGFSFFFARYLDKRPVATVGYMFHSRWIKEYLLGVLIGIVLVSLLFFFELGMGYLEINMNHITFTLLQTIFILALVKTLFQSAFEELLFRGYIFQNFIEATNTFIATAVLSTLFGIGHLLTPHSSWLAALNLSAFGVMLALGYVCTKSLWLPSGLHFSWNFFMRNIYSLPVSGSESSSTIFLVKQKGPEWLTGGNYGPEAGVPALILIITACFFIYYWPGIRVDSKMSVLWKNDLRK